MSAHTGLNLNTQRDGIQEFQETIAQISALICLRNLRTPREMQNSLKNCILRGQKLPIEIKLTFVFFVRI